MKRTVLGVFAGIVVLILFVVLCTFVRRPYEKILIERFGRLIEVPEKGTIAYNWYFKLPTDSLVRVDTRLHLKTLFLNEFTTKERETISVRTFVVWHIVDAVKFRNKASGSDDVVADLIQARVVSLVPQEFGQRTLDEIFNSTNPDTDKHIREIETNIAKLATEGSAGMVGLKDMGIEIADIGFSRIGFAPANTESVFSRMVAELNQRAKGFESEGLAEAEKIRSAGANEAETIRSKAVAEADGIRGDAERQASQIILSVANTDAAREFYQYWKSLEVLKASLAKNTVMVLSTDNPWIFNLFRALPGGPQRPLESAPTTTRPTANSEK